MYVLILNCLQIEIESNMKKRKFYPKINQIWYDIYLQDAWTIKSYR